MPTIRQSQTMPENIGERVDPMMSAPSQQGLLPPAELEMSPLMVCPMPGTPASFDLFVKQFYRKNGGVPQQRILPVQE